MLACAQGCLRSPPGFDSPSGTKRLEAAVEAAERSDTTEIPALINQLGSDDAAARLVAIRSLERITGETFGYDHAAPAAERAQAIERWRAAYTDAAGGGD